MRRSPHEHGLGQDVPYHIAYFDHVMVADPIEFGTALQDRFECLTMRQLNDWNRAEFARRRPGQTPEESVADILRQRERIRTLIAPLTDPDLEKPAFSHFFGVGFSTVGSALAGRGSTRSAKVGSWRSGSGGGISPCPNRSFTAAWLHTSD